MSTHRSSCFGRPQTELIQTVTRPIAGIDAPVVLYAPTWQGESTSSRYSSLLVGERIVEALLARGATVIPAASRGTNYPPAASAIKGIRARLAEDTRATGRAHIHGGAADRPTVAAVTNMADAMISDVSGIVTDFMASLKPFAMVASWTDVETFRTEIPTSLSAYVIASDLGNLDKVLLDMLGADPLAARRVERRRYYLGDFDGAEAAEAFVAYARGSRLARSSTRPNHSRSSMTGGSSDTAPGKSGGLDRDCQSSCREWVISRCESIRSSPRKARPAGASRDQPASYCPGP